MATLGVPLGCRAVHERVGELIAEAEEPPSGEQESGSRRPLTFQELEEVTVRACLAPVGGVPSADQVTLRSPALIPSFALSQSHET